MAFDISNISHPIKIVSYIEISDKGKLILKNDFKYYTK